MRNRMLCRNCMSLTWSEWKAPPAEVAPAEAEQQAVAILVGAKKLPCPAAEGGRGGGGGAELSPTADGGEVHVA
jgi:hypothetical protein